MAPKRFDQFCQRYAGQFQLQVIGHITQGTGLTLWHQQQPYDMNLQGYQHFD
jgi:thiamine monophosphate kinase